MYAIVKAGGRQYRVEEGSRIEVDHLGSEGDVELTPVLVVDGDTTLATPAELAGASVSARILGRSKGPKIQAFNYKAKANQRRRWGHRQALSQIEITKITKG